MKIPAGRVLGVPLTIGPSWLLMIPLVATLLFLGIEGGAGPTAGRWTTATLGALAILASVIVHEAGHVAAARRLGLTVGGLSVFLFGGYSEIGLDSARPGQRVLVALAGPVASAGAAGVLAAVAWAAPAAWGGEHVLAIVALVNLAVAGFNLLPGSPLDGGRILEGLLMESGLDRGRAATISAWLGVGVGLALLGVGVGAVWLEGGSGALLVPLGGLVVVLGWASRPRARGGRSLRIQRAGNLITDD